MLNNGCLAFKATESAIYRVVKMKEIYGLGVVRRQMQIIGEMLGCCQTGAAVGEFSKIHHEIVLKNFGIKSIDTPLGHNKFFFISKRYRNSSRMFATSINPMFGGSPSLAALLISRQSSYE